MNRIFVPALISLVFVFSPALGDATVQAASLNRFTAYNTIRLPLVGTSGSRSPDDGSRFLVTNPWSGKSFFADANGEVEVWAYVCGSYRASTSTNEELPYNIDFFMAPAGTAMLGRRPFLLGSTIGGGAECVVRVPVSTMRQLKKGWYDVWAVRKKGQAPVARTPFSRIKLMNLR